MGALVVFYGANKLQNSMLESDEFKKDPRNPYGELSGAVMIQGSKVWCLFGGTKIVQRLYRRAGEDGQQYHRLVAHNIPRLS